MVNIAATDEYGNTTTEPFEVQVYAPIPTIRSVTATGVLAGILDEEISGEPVHIFRIREGEGLSLIDPNALITKSEGNFDSSTLYS